MSKQKKLIKMEIIKAHCYACKKEIILGSTALPFGSKDYQQWYNMHMSDHINDEHGDLRGYNSIAKKERRKDGTFKKTINPKSHRIYVTDSEKALILWLRNNDVDPIGIIFKTE